MVPRCFYQKDLLSLIDYQIRSEGLKNFDAIDAVDKDSITAECLKIVDEHSWLLEHSDSDKMIMKFREYLLAGNHSNAYELAEVMRNNAVQSFANVMNELFEERAEDHDIEGYIECGYKPYQDKINGEILWSKTS